MRKSRRPQKRKLCGLLRDNKAAIVLEAAFIGPVYFFLTLSLFQIALLFFWHEVLDFVTRSAARQMQIGTIQQSVLNGTSFAQKTACVYSASILDCTRMAIQSQSTNDYYASAPYTVIADGNIMPSAFAYCNGKPGDQMILRVTYMAPIFIPGFSIFGATTANFGGGIVYPLTSTVSFVDELFPSAQAGGNTC